VIVPYISEVKYLGPATQDFIEVAVGAGADVSGLAVTIYNQDGTVRSVNAISGLSHTTIAGRDVYVVETGSPSTFSGLHKFGGVALSDGTTVHSFISFTDNPAAITAVSGVASGLTSTEIGSAGDGVSLQSNNNGGSYFQQVAPNNGSIPCLTKGTRVLTDLGDVNVEDLEPGMRLLTIDQSYAPVQLVLSAAVTRQDLLMNEKLAPVRIMAGALGRGLPKVDLLVSRQHRMLVTSRIAERMFGACEVLVAAIRLTALPGIFVDRSVGDVVYYHLLLDRHRVIFAENAPTESLYIGEQTISTLLAEVVEEISTLFPQVVQPGFTPEPARFIPEGKQQKRLIERHAKNALKPLSQTVRRATPAGQDCAAA